METDSITQPAIPTPTPSTSTLPPHPCIPIPTPAPSWAAMPPPETVEDPKFSLHPDDPKNFLKLSTALTTLTKKTLTDQEISRADILLSEYCQELLTVSFLFMSTLVSSHKSTCSPALWTFGNETKPSLCNSYRTIRTQFWTFLRILDVSL